jgi:hypothetical protein
MPANCGSGPTLNSSSGVSARGCWPTASSTTNACVLSQLLEYAEREKNIELADRIKQISPVSWKHVNFYGKYIFRDDGEVVDLDQMVSQLVAIEWEGADPKQPN